MSVSVCLILKLIYQFLFIVLDLEKVYIVFYSRIMAITRSDELRHSPSARDTKSSSQVPNSHHYPLIE
jgi:hypothetical protein